MVQVQQAGVDDKRHGELWLFGLHMHADALVVQQSIAVAFEGFICGCWTKA